MLIQITDAGLAKIKAATSPLKFATFVLTNGSGYIPKSSQTALLGNPVLTGVPSDPSVEQANLIRYSVVLDSSIGISFGEIGFFDADGTLIAIGVASSLMVKAKGSTTRLDFYMNSIGNNYDMWFYQSEQNNEFRIAILQSVDVLPQAKDAIPNCYVVLGADSSQAAFLAYTDRNGIWAFDTYQFGNQRKSTIVAANSIAVKIPVADWDTSLNPSYFGKSILQFTSGGNLGVCRYIESAIRSNDGLYYILNFASNLVQLPEVGDTVSFFCRQALSVSNTILPVASKTSLGGIKVGNSLKMSDDGVLDIDSESMPVISVNGKGGLVTLTASDITGFANVAMSGKYSDLIGTPSPYMLPPATSTTLGGVRLGNGGGLQINSGVLDLSFSPVKTINGLGPDATGNVTVPPTVGLTVPTQISGDINNYLSTGLFYGIAGTVNAPSNNAGSLEVMPVPNGFLQRWTDGSNSYFRMWDNTSASWTAWAATVTSASIQIATTSRAGLVSVGAGLTVTALGALSLQTGANGVALLDANGRLPISLLPDSIASGLHFVSGWDASNNVPQLTSGVGNTGSFYKVTVAGSTTLDGISDWAVGDVALFDGSNYIRLQGSPDKVQSVAGQTGEVVLNYLDINGLATVAHTGDYNDLINLPVIPTALSKFTNDVGYLTQNQQITVTGDVTGSGNTNIALTLVDVVTPGEFPKIKFNSKGQVLAGSALALADLPSIPFSSIASKPTTVAGYGITDALTANQPISLSGDVYGSGVTSINCTLSNSGVLPGTYAKVKVNSKGLVTDGYGLTLSDLPSIPFSNIASKPTTLAGYGITDNLVTYAMVGSASGVASLNSSGQIPNPQLPSDISVSTITTSGNGVIGGALAVTGVVTAGDLTITSDIRFKHDVKPLFSVAEKFHQIAGISWTGEDNVRRIGLSAQQVREVFPETVVADVSGRLSVAYPNLVGPLIDYANIIDDKCEGVNEDVAEMQDTIKGLLATVKDLQDRLAKVEAAK